MKGANVGVLVVVLAWAGLWAYLRVLGGRLARALDELERADRDRAGTVKVTEARPGADDAS